MPELAGGLAVCGTAAGATASGLVTGVAVIGSGNAGGAFTLAAGGDDVGAASCARNEI